VSACKFVCQEDEEEEGEGSTHIKFAQPNTFTVIFEQTQLDCKLIGRLTAAKPQNAPVNVHLRDSSVIMDMAYPARIILSHRIIHVRY
jgi:hypothetical protein